MRNRYLFRVSIAPVRVYHRQPTLALAPICNLLIIFVWLYATETLWSHVHSVTSSSRYDQISWNYSLRDTGVVWKKTTNVMTICSEKHGWESEGTLNIFVFPQQQFCRGGCCKPTMPYKTLYLAHPFGDHRSMKAKEKALSEMHAWFLKSSWKHVNNSGMEWLRNISTL